MGFVRLASCDEHADHASTRDHPADEVYVTGTFDDWGKSVKLEKEDGVFVKQVELPLGQTISYKVGFSVSFAGDNWETSDKPSIAQSIRV